MKKFTVDAQLLQRATVMSTSVQHVLSIKELLSRIFSYSTAKGNTSNTLVCRTWSNEALSII